MYLHGAAVQGLGQDGTDNGPSTLTAQLIPSLSDTGVMIGVALVLLLPWMISALGPATTTVYSRGRSGRTTSRTRKRTTSRASRQETEEEALERVRKRGRELLGRE